MLCLTRQRDESLILDLSSPAVLKMLQERQLAGTETLILVTVVDLRGDKTRLGIAADPVIPVHRQEVYESLKRENAGRPVKSLGKKGGER